ncbi:hypothetical protein Purlil1_8706 [Purpureocillium lilacinum]|uniref:Uncharacterized protein n=1 Tax=Purpureocillium lilacinum TaxID=33203 RepID=A0ABR0BSK1_PURLI|nr:hypothetical protein Purlil1_8706 [Purpureocillium lilacinum]
MLACWCRAVLCRTDNAVKCAGRGEAAGYEIPWTRDCEMAQCIAADAPITTDSPAPPSQASADLKASAAGVRTGAPRALTRWALPYSVTRDERGGEGAPEADALFPLRGRLYITHTWETDDEQRQRDMPPLQPRRIPRVLPLAPRAPLRALVPQLLRHDARLARADVMLGVSREPQLHLVARPRRVSSPEPLGSAARVASALPVVEVLRAHDDDDHDDDDDDGGGGEVGVDDGALVGFGSGSENVFGSSRCFRTSTVLGQRVLVQSFTRLWWQQCEGKPFVVIQPTFMAAFDQMTVPP